MSFNSTTSTTVGSQDIISTRYYPANTAKANKTPNSLYIGGSILFLVIYLIISWIIWIKCRNKSKAERDTSHIGQNVSDNEVQMVEKEANTEQNVPKDTATVIISKTNIASDANDTNITHSLDEKDVKQNITNISKHTTVNTADANITRVSDKTEDKILTIVEQTNDDNDDKDIATPTDKKEDETLTIAESDDVNEEDREQQIASTKLTVGYDDNVVHAHHRPFSMDFDPSITLDSEKKQQEIIEPQQEEEEDSDSYDCCTASSDPESDERASIKL